MANGVLGDAVKKSSKVVGDVACGVKRFIGNVVPKTLKRAITGKKSHKSRKSRKFRKSRKSRKN